MTQPFVDFAFLTADGAGIPLGSTIKIMPLGDSITQGLNTSYGSYRKQLYSLLTARGVAVNFVGALSDGTFADPDHEGLTGFEIDGIWAEVDHTGGNLLGIYTPNMILLLIGTNDIWHGAHPAPADALVTYGHLLDQIAIESPTVITVVGSIPPIDVSVAGPTVSANVDVFNAGLRTLVATKGPNFYFVDINAGLTTADLTDGVHPTDAGNDKMAAIWYPAVLGAMGPTNPRTMPDRLYDIHNVKDYGATGDGVTDDWAAIAACYNATDYFINTDAATGTNLVASFTGVVTSAFFTGTISGNNLTTSSPTGTIAIGQTIRDHGVGAFTPCKIVSGSGSSWVVDGSPQTVGPGAMQTNNILVASSITGTIHVGDWLINNGGTDASPSTVYPTYIESIQSAGVYVIRQYTPPDAGFVETLLQNFTSQAMMTVGITVDMASNVESTLGQGCYDVNNTTAFGNGLAKNGQLSYFTNVSYIQVNTPIAGLVHVGDTIAFQFGVKGEIYFPPGNYYVSKPIEFTAGGPHVIWRGERRSTTILANFDDFVFLQYYTASVQTVVEGFNIVNTHATGGGIRIGGTAVGIIRDCTVTANRGLSDYANDSQGGSGGFFGSFELTMDNCSVTPGANYSGSYGIARQTDGPIRNCRFINCERGFQTAGGQGAQFLIGCYFEKCGTAITLNRAPDGTQFSSAGVSLIGCWIKNCGIGIDIPGSSGMANILGNRIEGTNGQAPGGGNSQYGIVTGNTTNADGVLSQSMLAGMTVVGAYDVGGIFMAGRAFFVNGPTLIGVSVNATTPDPFWLDTDFNRPYIATQIGCSARHIYTVGAIPVGNDYGQVINVSDGTNTLGWGDTLIGTGTHTAHLAAQWNGTNWTVVGK